MTFADMNLADLTGALLGFSFTIFIFSYILGDNFLFRLATHIFIGVSAGYVVIVILYNVILQHLVFPFLEGTRSEKTLALIFLIPSVLLLMKIFPRLSKIGNPVIAVLVGTGAAAAIGGAVIGTVFPQTGVSIRLFSSDNLFNAFVILVGTISTLAYFQFNIRRDTNRPSALSSQLSQVSRWIGGFFIAITFGALFSGVYISAFTALIERITYLLTFIKNIIMPSLG